MEQGLRQVTFVDARGRKWARLLPLPAPDSDAEWGIPIGPPPLTSLGLPGEVEVALHNQLFERGILTERDAKRGRLEIESALRAALRVDAGRVFDLYRGQEA